MPNRFYNNYKMCSSSFEVLRIYFDIASASLTILSSLAVIFVCLKYNFARVLSFRILFFMSINDVIRGAITLFPKTSKYCGIILFIQNATYMSNLAWATCLSFILFQIIVKELENFSKYFIYWLIYCIIFIPTVQILPLITKTYTENDNTCLFQFNLTGTIFRYSLVYIPGTLMLIIMLILYIKVYKKIKLVGVETVKSLIFDMGFIYPLIIAVTCVPLAIARTVETITEDCLMGVIAAILDEFLILHGFINSLVFFSNTSVRKCLGGKKEDFDLNVNDSFAQSSLKVSFRSTFSVI